MKHTKAERFTRTLKNGKHFRHVQFHWADPAAEKPGSTHARVIVEALSGEPIRREIAVAQSSLTKTERQTLGALLEKLIAESIAAEGLVEEEDGEDEE